jgi:hypothetical protein
MRLERFTAGLTALAACGIAVGAAAPAAAQDWELLGSRTVAFLVDRDVISARGQGRFTTVRLCVANTGVNFRNVEVVFRNGERQHLPVNAFVGPGQCTRNFDLHGDARSIDRVHLAYGSIPNFRGQAVVSLFGRHARMGDDRGPGPGGPGRWQVLGTRMVGFERDRDEISGEGEGRFRAVRLCVARAPVQFRRVVVHFRSGERQELPVDRYIQPGQCTPALDLQGRARRIARVTMVYRAVPTFRGQAAVTLYGLH